MLSLVTLVMSWFAILGQNPDASAALSPECLGFGALISLLVSLLKGIPLVKKNPKIIGFILNILWVGIPALIKGGADFKIIAFCVMAQLSASVATYEVVTKPAKTLVDK